MLPKAPQDSDLNSFGLAALRKVGCFRGAMCNADLIRLPAPLNESGPTILQRKHAPQPDSKSIRGS